MPMYNWIELNEHEDLIYLSKTGKLCKRAVSVYNRMLDELIKEFGISEDIIKIIRNRIRIEEMYEKQSRTEDTSNQLQIEILEIKTEELKSKHTKGDLFKSVISIEKAINVPKNPRELTVKEFYKYVDFIAKDNSNGAK